MRVSGVNSGVTSANKTQNKKSGSGAFAAHLDSASQADEASSISSLAAPAPVNSLFMIQEIDSDESPRKKAITHGQTMVEYLDDIRVGLLTGDISHSVLKNLDGLVNKWREGVSDPDLEALIGEIELRAAVELAKLESA